MRGYFAEGENLSLVVVRLWSKVENKNDLILKTVSTRSNPSPNLDYLDPDRITWDEDQRENFQTSAARAYVHFCVTTTYLSILRIASNKYCIDHLQEYARVNLKGRRRERLSRAYFEREGRIEGGLHFFFLSSVKNCFLCWTRLSPSSSLAQHLSHDVLQSLSASILGIPGIIIFCVKKPFVAHSMAVLPFLASHHCLSWVLNISWNRIKSHLSHNCPKVAHRSVLPRAPLSFQRTRSRIKALGWLRSKGCYGAETTGIQWAHFDDDF